MPSKYVRKTSDAVDEAAPHLPLPCRITDLLLDMQDRGKGPSRAQLLLLGDLSARAHEGVLLGELATERRRSRIWDAPAAPAAQEEPEYTPIRQPLNLNYLMFRGRRPVRKPHYHG